MTTSFHRAETMTEIVSLLDSDEGIEAIMVEILVMVAEHTFVYKTCQVRI